jgi:hypothetical protein
MANPQRGKPFQLPRPEPMKDRGDQIASYAWQLSEDARRDIDEIEANIRQAEQKAGVDSRPIIVHQIQN